MLYLAFNNNFIPNLFLFLLALPLLSAAFLGFRYKYNYCKHDNPQNFLYTYLIVVSLLLLLMVSLVYCYIYKIDKNLIFLVDCGVWFSTNSYTIPWNFIFDPLSISMIFIVYIVSGLVHLYSLSYMKGDPNILRFLSYLSLFTFFMLWLVSAGNLVQLFIGWEGVGLCSFLLISFWTERTAANKAAVKAMVVNKIGDSFILLGIAFLLQSTGTVDIAAFSFFYKDSSCFYNFYTLLNMQMSWFGTDFDLISVICFFLFLGVMAKSAQFGFHTWLPDAMEGPTPVSALIHAATMVTAGVFLLLRMSLLFQLSGSVQTFMIFIGVLTMLFAASVALFQNDIKRVIAYSTCSQLGYMVTACGFSFYGAAFFHLLSHAFFKALLFLCAGAVIHFFNDEQDIRKMGGAALYNPIAYICMFVASLALLGFPYTSGFYSKDLLLELFFISTSAYSSLGYFFGLFVATLTSFYSFRLLFLVFSVKPKSHKLNYFNFHLEDRRISFVLIFLFFMTLFFGFFYKKYLYGFIYFAADASELAEVIVPFFWKILPLIAGIIGWLFAYYINYLSKFVGILNHTLYDFLINRWYFDLFQNYIFTLPIFNFSRNISFLGLEKGWIEFIGPTGLTDILVKFSIFINRLQSMNFFDYFSYFLLFLLGFIIFS